MPFIMSHHSTATVIIRGEEHFLKYQVDDDPSTNSCELEWDWENQNDRIVDLTDEENDAVELALMRRYEDYRMYGDD